MSTPEIRVPARWYPPKTSTIQPVGTDHFEGTAVLIRAGDNFQPRGIFFYGDTASSIVEISDLRIQSEEITKALGRDVEQERAATRWGAVHIFIKRGDIPAALAVVQDQSTSALQERLTQQRALVEMIERELYVRQHGRYPDEEV